MNLHEVHIENFRGIRSGTVVLDRTTVLIGENDAGKSAVLEALLRCLGDADDGGLPAFDDDDVHHPDAEAGEPPATDEIRIVATFRESEAGRWSEHRFDALRDAMVRADDDRRLVMLELRGARTSAEAAITTTWSFLDHGGARREAANRPEVLARLRELTPLVVVRGGLAWGNYALRASRENDDASAGSLEREVEAIYRRLLADGSSVSTQELDAGYRAAREVTLAADAIEPSALPKWILRPPSRVDANDAHTRRGALHGSGAEHLGLLLIVGAILGARPGDFDDDAEPLLIVEDPEAHLHPMTLASVWDVLEAVRIQKIVTTQSGDLLTGVPLLALRRLRRMRGKLRCSRLGPRTLSLDEQRRVRYHVRARRGSALFARCWLLVEGETEFWLLPELARQVGFDFAVEGVHCIEFAQCGVVPLAKLAGDLGIQWHLLADGDEAGTSYAKAARAHLSGGSVDDHVTQLPELDVERHLWTAGYDAVFAEAATSQRDREIRRRHTHPGPTIARAIKRTSKPHLALAVLEDLAGRGPKGVPPLLRRVVETAVRLARRG